MDNNPQGPYKHFERPTEGRAANQKPGSHFKWGIGICIFIIIIVALLPTVHHLSVKNIQHAEQPKEVERVSKKSSSKKKKSVKKHKKAKSSKVSSSSRMSGSSSSDQSSSVKPSDTYVVKRGDTLTSIAQKNNISISDLMQINNLTDSSSIDAGQTLKLK